MQISAFANVKLTANFTLVPAGKLDKILTREMDPPLNMCYGLGA